MDEPGRLARRLAGFLAWSNDKVREALSVVRKSTKNWRVELGQPEQAARQAIFDAASRSRLPILATAPRVSGEPLEQ